MRVNEVLSQCCHSDSTGFNRCQPVFTAKDAVDADRPQAIGNRQQETSENPKPAVLILVLISALLPVVFRRVLSVLCGKECLLLIFGPCSVFPVTCNLLGTPCPMTSSLHGLI